MLTANRLRKHPSGRATSPPQETVTLSTGAVMPLVAFGTLMESLQPDPVQTVRIIEDALEVGYRHLDTAQVYNTETMVGQALHNKMKQGLITRGDVFVTTKLWRNCYRRQDVVQSLKASLARLGLEYVDLFIIHWPTAFKPGPDMFPKDDSGKFIYADVDYLDTWKGMEECVEQGLARAIGVSNFNSEQLMRIMANCKIKPTNNQIEAHPYLSNNKLIDFCKTHNITIMAYSPLFGFNPSYREEQGWPSIYTDKTIKAIADKNKATPAQVALRFQLQKGVGVTPKSSKRQRMEENIASLFLRLSDDDMAALEGCNKNLRLNAELPDHPHYPFNIEF